MKKMIEVFDTSKRVINFVGMFPLMTTISAIAVVASIILIMTKGLNYGVDFRGGAEVQVRFTSEVEIQTLRASLSTNGLNVSSVQSIGAPGDHEFLIKVPSSSDDINKTAQSVVDILQKSFINQGVEVRRTEIVGPKAGEQLRNSGIWAVIWSLLGITVYVGLRFDIKYAPGAVISLLHDALIVLGIFVVTGKEFNLQILGAILALIGYSVYDTVVIYDRIREHERSSQRLPITDLINKGLTETLGRTILTGGTTFSVCLIMFFFGGGIIHEFFFALWTGIIVGTYSSIFVASPLVLLLYRFITKRKWSSKVA